jgi:hypothetical protein
LTAKNTRRRDRSHDPLASREAVKAVLDQLIPHLPSEIRWNENNLVTLLRAVRHTERYPASDTRRGRPGRFDRELLLKVGSSLRTILEREKGISVASFVDHYLRILSFPEDVLRVLSSGAVNIFEAEQLARINGARLGVPDSRAARTRADLLTAHLQKRLSASGLRLRVTELLGSAGDAQEKTAGEVVLKEDELEDFDPHDPTHLFYGEIKRMGFALREIRPEDLNSELLDEFLAASEPLWNVIRKIEKRRAPKVAKLPV